MLPSALPPLAYHLTGLPAVLPVFLSPPPLSLPLYRELSAVSITCVHLLQFCQFYLRACLQVSLSHVSYRSCTSVHVITQPFKPHKRDHHINRSHHRQLIPYTCHTNETTTSTSYIIIASSYHTQATQTRPPHQPVTWSSPAHTIHKPHKWDHHINWSHHHRQLIPYTSHTNETTTSTSYIIIASSYYTQATQTGPPHHRQLMPYTNHINGTTTSTGHIIASSYHTQATQTVPPHHRQLMPYTSPGHGGRVG